MSGEWLACPKHGKAETWEINWLPGKLPNGNRAWSSIKWACGRRTYPEPGVHDVVVVKEEA